MSNYGTLAGFKTYHDARGNVYSTLDDAQISAALLVASEWLDASYREAFPGCKAGQRAQIRDWPRTDAYDVNDDYLDYLVVPDEVINATYEAALRQGITPGSLSVDFTPNKYKKSSVDGAVFVEYMQYSYAEESQTKFMIVEEILSNILSGGNSSNLSGSAVRA